MFALLVAMLFVGSGPEAEATLRPLLEERVATGRNPGIVVGVQDGEARRVVAAGKASANGPAVDGATLFEIGSISKVFTTTLLAQMVVAKEVGLDDPIEKHLPPGTAVPKRGGKSITLRHLAMHTSGLPRMPANLDPKDGANPYADYGAERLLALLATVELERDPGTQYAYSNLGAGLLGHLLSRRAGRPYEQLLRERILEPLGMKETGLALAEPLRKRLASGHANGEPAPGWDFDVLGAAGGIRSTTNDLLKFAAAWGAGGKLEPLLATMLADTQEGGGPGTRIGLGWHVTTRFGERIVWHNGMTGGFSSYLGFVPGTRRAVTMLTNANEDADAIAEFALDARRLVEPLAPLPKYREVAVAAAILDTYVGEYELAPTFKLTITREGTALAAQATGQGKNPIFASGESEFFFKVVEARVTFEREAGKVVRLVLHQNGRAIPGKKVR